MSLADGLLRARRHRLAVALQISRQGDLVNVEVVGRQRRDGHRVHVTRAVVADELDVQKLATALDEAIDVLVRAETRPEPVSPTSARAVERDPDE